MDKFSFNQYSSRIGNPEIGYFSSDRNIPAKVKAIANKYLKVREGVWDHEIDGKVIDGDLVGETNYTFYAEDLDFAPVIRGKWQQSKVCDNIYIRYEGGDLFKALFLCPHLAYDKRGGSSIDESYRIKNILHIHSIGANDHNQVMYAYSKLDKSEKSSYVGPRHGYDVVCTYVHYLEFGLHYLLYLLNVFTHEFPTYEISSEYDLIQAVVTTSAAFTYPFYPVNYSPVSYNDAEKLLSKIIVEESKSTNKKGKQV